MGALAFLTAFLPKVPAYVAAGAQLANVISIGLEKSKQLEAENRDPTDADWDEVNASIAAKRARLHS